MRYVLSISVVAALLALHGCGGGEGDGGGGGDGGVDDAGDDFQSDSGQTADAGTTPQEPDASATVEESAEVEWMVEPEPLTLDSDVGLRFAYPYELRITGSPFVYSVTLHRCMNVAGREPNCWTESMPNLPDTYSVGWGIDPTEYGLGENSYTFRVVVTRGSEIVSEDSVELGVTVTDCGTCVGSGNEPE